MSEVRHADDAGSRVSYLQGRPGHEECTFDCPKCGNEMIEITKFK